MELMGARDGELFREESFDVRIENLTYLEAVKTLQRLSGGSLPVAIRSAVLKSRYDDPRFRGGFLLDPLDLGGRLAHLCEVDPGRGGRARLRLDPRDPRDHDKGKEKEEGCRGPADHEDALLPVTKHRGPPSSRRGW
ncbi:MAG: hypothetical protein B7Z62_02305 [Deltaproteobacteria bacterium 37-65-8]|nr:MAG: hypothetical protein B7Z62_02305 [Deltaproteobacteria bacterium 37-65-8]